MLLHSIDGRSSARLWQQEAGRIACRLESDFAAARIDAVAVDGERVQNFLSGLAQPGKDPVFLQSSRPGELVIALNPIPGSGNYMAKITASRLRELGGLKASDMLTLSFEVAGDDLPRLARAGLAAEESAS
ncbi:MAG: hypothetical protein H6807_00350 [Planctomycetes bacterium]|nr:hypothetical protein [Planctomycetota bacterium]